MAKTLEGVVVKYADRIAYVNHDLDDAFFAGVLSKNDIPARLSPFFVKEYSERVDMMVSAVIEASMGKPQVAMVSEIAEAMMDMRAFLKEQVYQNLPEKQEEGKAFSLLCRLYEYYVHHPEELPAFYKNHIETQGVERMVCDYIAGMTDRYAIATYRTLFLPEFWKG